MGKVTCLFLGSKEALVEKNLGWKGLLEVVWLLQLLKQGHCQVRPGYSGVWLHEHSLLVPSVPVPVWPLLQCLYIHLGLSLLLSCVWRSWWQQPDPPGLGNFSSGQTQLPEWLRLVVLYKYELYQQISNVYLERFHHKLRIHKENSTDTEFPLLQLLHQLFHHWQVRVEFNLTWDTLRILTGRNVKQTGTLHSFMQTWELHLNKNW